jgi:hypothetical protein
MRGTRLRITILGKGEHAKGGERGASALALKDCHG